MFFKGKTELRRINCITNKIKFSMTNEKLPDVKLLQRVLILTFSKCVCAIELRMSQKTQLYISTNLS